MTPEILFEDNHIIAVNKPSGIAVQHDDTGHEPLEEIVRTFIKEKYKKPGNVFLGVVHRIDRPVSGVVIFARNSRSLARINEMFQKRTIKKTYWAVVKDKPPATEGTLIHFLKRDERQNRTTAHLQEIKNSSRSWLDYKILAQSDTYYLLDINPHTGRHHQIRVQLSAAGCPIKGDVKYGARRGNEDRSIHLHARSISFTHPVKNETIQITAPVPNETLWKFFEKAVAEG